MTHRIKKWGMRVVGSLFVAIPVCLCMLAEIVAKNPEISLYSATVKLASLLSALIVVMALVIGGVALWIKSDDV